MSAATEATAPAEVFLSRQGFAALFGVLHGQGYQVVGPTIDQEAIVYNRITSVDDLPHGWTDVQAPGKYRLERRDDDALFGYVVGPHSWKRYLFPPQAMLSEADRTEKGWRFREAEDDPPKLAFLGVRACELAAIEIQDRVFLGGPYVDPIYQRRRERCLFIAVNCTQAASTCFCTSMNTGPRCTRGFDLALTELPDGFVIEIADDGVGFPEDFKPDSGGSLGTRLMQMLAARIGAGVEFLTLDIGAAVRLIKT